ncbi:hypothetical protein QO058_04705 [Bosea vestrisii]|uniref:hypothetical protein n=1 Tax=Bosea vestrisii TaxID=151416 RepID=UPI0024DFDE6D|nr:hypothetical protein [Bosea vestrisii]WID97569.1 hypothetical protein QO058_04705 [Bosea vestrisii]
MSSSTSSSDPRWGGFGRTFLLAATFLVAALLALAFLVDPYDSGRSPLKFKAGVSPQGPRTAAASRGRDPHFSGAIFGNSHIQLVSPELLAQKTGIPFVSLIAPATGPRETLILLDWFLRHRKEPARALVIGIDVRWCTPDPTLAIEKPFPFWLFERSTLRYLAGLMRFDVIEETLRRLRYLSAKAPERARPDGYWDYEAGYEVQGFHSDPVRRARLLEPLDTSGGNITGPFPAATALREVLGRMAPDVPVVLVRPPNFVSALPVPGSAGAGADAACRDAYAALVASRPKTALIDWRIDRPENRAPDNYFDHTHYRQKIAGPLGADIAEAIIGLR